MIERIATIALLNILFYCKSIYFTYASDDIPASQRPKDPRKWMEWIWVNEGRARHSHQTDHALTMFIHTLICIFIYLGFGKSDVSFMAAMLFAFNPLNNQCAVWISGRSYAMSALAMTSVLVMPIMAPVALILASYYNAGFASIIVFLGSPVPWVCFFIPLAWAVHFRRFRTNVGAKIKMEMFGEDRKFHMGKVAMFVKTFGFYTFHSIFPIKVTFYHSFLQSAAGALKHRAHTFKCRFFWIGLSLILSFIYYLFSRPWDLSSFGLVWWFVCIVPFCNLFRIHQEIAERYVYLPNVGLMYFLASILDPAVAVAWAAMYAGIMWHWMEAYRNDYTLTLMSNANSSDAWFSWHVRAMKAWEYKSHQEAVLLWTTALQISPKEFKLNLNMASALMLGGHKEHALKFIKIAEDNIPEGQEEQAGKLIKEWHNNQLAIVL